MALLFFVLFALVVAAYWIYTEGIYVFQLRRNPTVVLTSSGFEPKRVVIKKGDMVTFVNKGFDLFWPASNMHPNHSIYSEFDPRRSINKGEPWSFVFDTVGVWDYHDHLRSNFGGAVVVLDDSFRLSKDPGCNNISDLSFVQKQRCWYSDIKKIAKESGSGEAMNFLSDLYKSDSEFQQHCHDMSHLIGEMAYKEYKENEEFVFDTRTTYCGYGFYHGFVEALSFDGEDILNVRDFCSGLDKVNPGDVVQPMMDMACFHGIGHAAFDKSDSNNYGNERSLVDLGTETCRYITKDLDWYYFKQCMTGVYNALGVAYSNNQYGLEMKESDPTWLCRSEPEETRKYCYAEVVPAWLYEKYDTELNVDNIIDFVKNIEPLEDAQMSTYTSVSEYAKNNLRLDVEIETRKKCVGAPDGLKTSCIEGVATALTTSGDPGNEHVRALSFCKSFPSYLLENGKSLRELCFNHVFEGFTNMYSSEKITGLCSVYSEESVEICKNIIQSNETNK